MKKSFLRALVREVVLMVLHSSVQIVQNEVERCPEW